MVIIGIDPGAKGAMAFLNPETGVERIVPFSEIAYKTALSTVRNGYRPAVAVVEKVGAMPGQGVCSMFSFGQNYGYIRGLLVAYDIPIIEVSPRRWKKVLGLGADKRESITLARRLYPSVDLRRTKRCKVDSDGMAEALLIARYGAGLAVGLNASTPTPWQGTGKV